MSISDPNSKWEQEQPQRTFFDTIRLLHDQGHSVESLRDLMLIISLSGECDQRGPRAVAGRLILLADRFTAEADRLEGRKADAAKH